VCGDEVCGLVLSSGRDETETLPLGSREKATEIFFLVLITVDSDSKTTLAVIYKDGTHATQTLSEGFTASDLTPESLKIGGTGFEGVVADIRYQTEINNYDIINGQVDQYTKPRTKPDEWFICKGFECNGMQYNTMYSFN